MDASILIARLIGPVLLVVGLTALIHPKSLHAIAQEFMRSHALMFIAGILALLGGLAIVNTHNLWTTDWRVIITIYGWLAVLAGILRIAIPERLKTIGEALLARRGVLRFTSLAQVVLGALLTWKGYSY